VACDRPLRVDSEEGVCQHPPMAARILDFRPLETPASDDQVDARAPNREPDEQPAPVESASPAPADALVIDADADGRRVRVSAKDEIVFQCGEASITLKSDGRVIVRGTYVETHSTGTNRIKGGQVRIN
jgi:hypothetical protein